MPAQTKKIVILLGDIVVLYLALFFTVYFRYGNIDQSHSNFTTLQLFLEHVKAFTPLIFLWLVVFYIHNLYEITSAKNTLEFYTALGRSLVANFFMAVLFFYFINLNNVTPKTNLFIYFLFFSVLFLLWRGQINRLLKKIFLIKTIIITEDESGGKLALKLNQSPQIGYRVNILIGPPPSAGSGAEFQPQVLDLNKKVDLASLIKKENIRALIIDDKFLERNSFATLVSGFIDDVEIINISRFNERVWRKVDLNGVTQLWFLNNFASGRRSFYEAVKRGLDFLVGLVMLPFAFIFGIVIGFLIKLEDGGPVFYQQTRIGQRKKPFMLIKFRTMRTDAESGGARLTAENDQRITRIGRFLRKTRLDELPQLINILKGEMSFVGPRAERPEFHQILMEKIPFYERRYLVKPGLTGWAQINYYGFNLEDTKEKLSYDFYYLKNRSLIFDIGIILKTINIVLLGLGY